jgi:hypothetical protein
LVVRIREEDSPVVALNPDGGDRVVTHRVVAQVGVITGEKFGLIFVVGSLVEPHSV